MPVNFNSIKHVEAAKAVKLGYVDYSLTALTVASRTADYLSTRHCVTSAFNNCEEKELPKSLVKNVPLFISFEAAMAVAGIVSETELVRHGHKKLGRVIELATGLTVAGVAVHNYKVGGR